MAKSGKARKNDSAKKDASTNKQGAHSSKSLKKETKKPGDTKDDSKLLKSVDEGASSGSKSKGKRSNDNSTESSLKGDLSDFAKSLGLADTIPDFVGLSTGEKIAIKRKGRKERKEKSGAHGNDGDENKHPVNKAKPASVDVGTVKEKKSKKSKAVKKAEANKGDGDESDVDIPGFKVKSAMDSQPLSKARRLIIEPSPQWFSISLPALDIDDDAPNASEEVVIQKLKYAEELLDNENKLYSTHGSGHKALSSSDKSFMSKILSSGTLSDRVSALTLIVQESPIHAVNTLGQLMQMAQKKNRREALLAIGSLKDLMVINLLPSNRKLKYFADQPITAKNVSNAHLVAWAFENKLKKAYFDLIQIMESMAYDPVQHTRMTMVVFFEELLESKPEQEKNLLRLLVNKLGDNERQVAAKASYLVLKLLNAHPNMKYIVVKTVQELLLTRSSTKERAQYYTMITLNQIILTSKDTEAANLLLDIYFIFFKKLLKVTTGKVDNEDEAAAVDSDGGEDGNGKGDNDRKGKKEPREQKVYIGQKALKKAKEEMEKKRAEEERSMDHRMLAAILTGVNRALPFSKMADDVMDKHVGVIFQIAHAGNFNTVVQSLVLLFQIVKMRPGIGDRFYRTLYDSLLDPRVDGTSKKAMYLNVLYRALKADQNTNRVMAFVKRIIQVCLYYRSEFASGALFLVSQILLINTRIKAMLTQPEDHGDDEPSGEGAYDAAKRDPRFAHAESSCLWEMDMLNMHFHPSVTHSVQQIFADEEVAAISNLHNHSLAHFLDRFVFRKPKASGSAKEDEDGLQSAKAPPRMRGQSLMQPYIDGEDASAAAGDNYLVSSKRVGGIVGGLDLTSDKITQLQKSEVPADEQFFYQFFQTRKARMGKKTKKSRQGDEDGLVAGDDAGFSSAVHGDDELDEDEVWKAMSSAIPKDELDADDVDDDDEDLLSALREDESDLEIDDGDAGSDEESDLDGLSDSAIMDDDDGDDDADGDEDSDCGLPLADSEADDSDDGEDSKGESADSSKKRKSESDNPSKKRKKAPMFGSFEDYAHLIDNDDGLY